MRNKIKIQCPAKINLTLKIKGKRPDGFHEIDSIMQTINLFDYLMIEVNDANENKILLSGTSSEIPYNEKNLVYKACLKFLETTGIKNKEIKIHIEKHIPVSAGLAGGSTDASGTIFGLNELFGKPLDENGLHKLCSELGSDLNVCLKGGRLKTSGRGEIIEPLRFEEFDVSLIKPNNLGISAKEAYTKFSEKFNKHNTFVNDLEWAIIDDYEELQKIKELYPKSIMSGSGSTYYILNDKFGNHNGYTTFNGLKAISYGVKEINP